MKRLVLSKRNANPMQIGIGDQTKGLIKFLEQLEGRLARSSDPAITTGRNSVPTARVIHTHTHTQRNGVGRLLHCKCSASGKSTITYPAINHETLNSGIHSCVRHQVNLQYDVLSNTIQRKRKLGRYYIYSRHFPYFSSSLLTAENKEVK
jgi:hypothetical protein